MLSEFEGLLFSHMLTSHMLSSRMRLFHYGFIRGEVNIQRRVGAGVGLGLYRGFGYIGVGVGLGIYRGGGRVRFK